jgi:hypothetical protein
VEEQRLCECTQQSAVSQERLQISHQVHLLPLSSLVMGLMMLMVDVVLFGKVGGGLMAMFRRERRR